MIYKHHLPLLTSTSIISSIRDSPRLNMTEAPKRYCVECTTFSHFSPWVASIPYWGDLLWRPLERIPTVSSYEWSLSSDLLMLPDYVCLPGQLFLWLFHVLSWSSSAKGHPVFGAVYSLVFIREYRPPGLTMQFAIMALCNAEYGLFHSSIHHSFTPFVLSDICCRSYGISSEGAGLDLRSLGVLHFLCKPSQIRRCTELWHPQHPLSDISVLCTSKLSWADTLRKGKFQFTHLQNNIVIVL